MARYERVAQIVAHLSAASAPLSLEHLCGTLGASTATVKRLVRFMREELSIPVEFDRGAGGYRIDAPGAVQAAPGPLALAPEDRAVLRAGFDLLGQIAPGLIDSVAAAVQGAGAGPPAGAAPLLRATRRQEHPVHAGRFRTIARALLSMRQLRIRIRADGADVGADHIVSPQRLTLHRGTWYLAAWCHADDRLRLFPVHRIESAAGLSVPAERIEDRLLDATFESGYGLAPGEANAVAVLHFAASAAREIGEQRWHPLQRLARHGDGSVSLRIPYGDATELIGDILRWGAAVEVVSPAALRRRVATTLAAAAHRYG